MTRLGRERRASSSGRGLQTMSESEVVPVPIPLRVIPQLVGPVTRRDNDLDLVGAVVLEELVGVADDEIH
jgi:hypothetical protein